MKIKIKVSLKDKRATRDMSYGTKRNSRCRSDKRRIQRKLRQEIARVCREFKIHLKPQRVCVEVDCSVFCGHYWT